MEQYQFVDGYKVNSMISVLASSRLINSAAIKLAQLVKETRDGKYNETIQVHKYKRVGR